MNDEGVEYRREKEREKSKGPKRCGRVGKTGLGEAGRGVCKARQPKISGVAGVVEGE